MPKMAKNRFYTINAVKNINLQKVNFFIFLKESQIF